RSSELHILGHSVFLQAEDGIRHGHVTGVQTCALPISKRFFRPPHSTAPWRGGRAVECGGLENRFGRFRPTRVQIPPPPLLKPNRSEERRVGKECIFRGWRWQ